MDVESIYKRRFTPDLKFRDQMWQVLCRSFFQKYVPLQSTVLEVAAGYCEFINNIQAARKIAVDINPSTQEHAQPDVQVLLADAGHISGIAENSVDIAFTSNFFEHLTRDQITATVEEVRRVLVPGGKFLVLQPNIRFCAKDYWMFFDHITPIDDRALVELFETKGFRIVKVIPRFLPYTTQGSLPKSIFFLRMYLFLRPAWRLLGQQSFIMVAKE